MTLERFSLTEAGPPRDRYPDLAGKVAVVTGGSRGIGAAAALALAANQTAVAVVGRDEAAIAASVGACSALGARAVGVTADCTVESDLDALRRKVADDLGPVDILAAFAGGNGMPVPTDAETGEHWREVIETDLTSTFLTVSAFLPAMIARHSGVIITMSSAAARQAAKSSAAYAAAKSGVIAFTRRLGQPDDVAAAALFLASSASSWITGVTLDIAGGKIML